MTRKTDSAVPRIKPASVNADRAMIAAKFKKLYPRVARAPVLLEMSKDEAATYPSDPSMKAWRLRDPPLDGYVEVRRHRLNERFAVNGLLWYRILRHIYGSADVSAGLVVAAEKAHFPLEWSYSLQVHAAGVVEVRSASQSTMLFLWATEGLSKRISRQVAETALEFLNDLVDAVRRGLGLFDFQRERLSAVSVAVPNPFVEKYAAAAELIELAARVDGPNKSRRLLWKEQPDFGLTGSVYLGAILFLYTALEAFEQLVRGYFLRPQYRTEVGNYYVQRLSLRERIARLHEFCDGFAQPPATKAIDKKLRFLNLVRNQVIHGNTSEQTDVFALREDGFLFAYHPEQDDENKAASASYVPFTRTLVRKKHAQHVQAVVDDVVGAIVDALLAQHQSVGHGFRTSLLLERTKHGQVAPSPNM